MAGVFKICITFASDFTLIWVVFDIKVSQWYQSAFKAHTIHRVQCYFAHQSSNTYICTGLFSFDEKIREKEDRCCSSADMVASKQAVKLDFLNMLI